MFESLFFTAAAILGFTTLSLLVFVGSQGFSVFNYMGLLAFFDPAWDQNTESFGVLPLLYGSLMAALITLLISAPLVILVSIFMVEIASPPAAK